MVIVTIQGGGGEIRWLPCTSVPNGESNFPLSFVCLLNINKYSQLLSVEKDQSLFQLFISNTEHELAILVDIYDTGVKYFPTDKMICLLANLITAIHILSSSLSRLI